MWQFLKSFFRANAKVNTPRASDGPPGGDRVVRVFVSSTFRDMHEDRDVLVKYVFPQLRNECAERGVTFIDVDLRWGITSDQARRGEVLPICLAEIDRCRPYFLGLLGDRYGWILDNITPDLIREYPWLAGLEGRSVTELEILHGALNAPGQAREAFIYLRAEGEAPEDAISREKLQALKTRLRSGRLTVRDNYPNPEALGRLVLADLRDAIDRRFPEVTAPDPLAREAAEHQAFALTRYGVYIGRAEDFGRLDRHASMAGPPLAVLGASGGGKSALLANWADRWSRAHPSDVVLTHFIGSTNASVDWAAMLRRLLGELHRRLGLTADIPTSTAALIQAFANGLHQANARAEGPDTRIVLVLDGLDQLEDREGALDLVWLPPTLPPNVRLVVSTLPGRPEDELKRRGWPTLTVAPLTESDRGRLIEAFLTSFRKRLSPAQSQRIASASPASNPLFLRALLEELRVFGHFDQLDRKIDFYLQAPTTNDLYQRILSRWEEDFDHDLVREVMTAIWAARRGLTEPEILDLLGRDGNPLPRHSWSPLYLAAEHALVSRSGKLNFFHDYLRRAVRDRYLATDADRSAAHLRLADYFRVRGLPARRIDETPWQLAQAQAWEPLHDLIREPSFLAQLWKADEFDAKRYWVLLQQHSGFRATATYGALLLHPTACLEGSSAAAGLLQDLGHYPEAARLWEGLAAEYHRLGRNDDLLKVLPGLGVSRQVLGDLDGALALHQERAAMCRRANDLEGLHRALNDLANNHYQRGEYQEGLVLALEQEQICTRLGNDQGLCNALLAQALMQEQLEGKETVRRLLERARDLCKRTGNPAQLGIVLNNLAGLLDNRREGDQALALYEEVERIFTEIGHHVGVAMAWNSQGMLLFARGDHAGALQKAEKAEPLLRAGGVKNILAICLADQAEALWALDRREESLDRIEQACTLAETHGFKDLFEQFAPLAGPRPSESFIAEEAGVGPRCRCLSPAKTT